MESDEGEESVDADIAHFRSRGWCWVDCSPFASLVEGGEEFLVWLGELGG